MYGAIDLNELLKDHLILKEFMGDIGWRILPVDTLPAGKFVAEMKLAYLDDKMFPGSVVAHGYVYNDSRGVFYDGQDVRTSLIKDIYEFEGATYIETRNTMYKMIGQPIDKEQVAQYYEQGLLKQMQE